MIQPSQFIELLRAGGIDFFAGVPDSLLKNLCAYITDNLSNNNHVIAANEGGAVGLAAGYHLATGKIGCVYMQNSGEGNIVNPLLSLADEDVYRIPMLFIIGWRGEPGVHDEPQHIKQGKVTLSLLESMGTPYVVLDTDWESQVRNAIDYIRQTGKQYALIVRKGTFDDYSLQNEVPNSNTLSREDAIKIAVDHLPSDAVVVSTTGMISRELFEYREAQHQGHAHDFLTVGSMGHASQIAMGIALHKPNRSVFCFDGDGAAIMHMGGMAVIASRNLHNFTHIVFNNAAHDSVGGQPTVGYQIDLKTIAEGMGYGKIFSVHCKEDLIAALQEPMDNCEGSKFIEVLVHRGARKDLGRPTTTPIQNKESFMNNLLG